MNWDDLRIVLAVARRGTLAAASADLGLNPSTLNRRLARLERDLGAQLFDRAPRGYRLTSIGEALIPHAEEAEEAILAGQRQILGHDSAATGEVRLSLVEDLLPLVSPILTGLTDSGITIALQVGATLDEVGRETDLALRPSDNPPTSVVGRRICGVAWARYSRVLEPTNWVGYRERDHLRAVQWRHRSHPSARMVAWATSVSGVASALACVDAQGLLPCFVGDRNPALHRLCEPIPDAESTLWLLFHTSLRRAARVRAVTSKLIPAMLLHQDLFEGRAAAIHSDK